MQKPGCRMCILALAAFTFLTAALPVSWRKKKLARTNCILVFFFIFSSFMWGLKDEKATKHNMYPSFFPSAHWSQRWRVKKLGCTLCILAFSSFTFHLTPHIQLVGKNCGDVILDAHCASQVSLFSCLLKVLTSVSWSLKKLGCTMSSGESRWADMKIIYLKWGSQI